MEKEFIPYEQALALKELGFDEPCLGHYIDYTEPFTHDKIKGKLNLGFLGHCKSEPYDWNNTPKWGVKSTKYISSPLYQQAFRWFREKHNFAISIQTYSKEFLENMKDMIPKQYNYHITNSEKYDKHYREHFSSYEETELECLKKLIEIVLKTPTINENHF